MLPEPKSPWAGRRVLVTGAGGFIGSHLVEQLVRLGADVRAMVHYNSRSDIGMLVELDGDVRASIEIVHSDICDPSAVRAHVMGREAVFHLAALIGIPYSYAAPASYVAANVGGTLNVLQAVRDLDVPRMIHTSTSETYGTARYVPIDERHPLQAQSPYSASKIGADSLVESFHRSFGTPVATIRPFNTYGPRQSARAIVPTIAAQLVAGRDELTLGDLRPVRDLTYVEDTVRGFLAVAESDLCVGVVTNVGSGSGISVGDLARMLARIAGRPEIAIKEEERRYRPDDSEVMELVADLSAARERCGWSPAIELEEGLSRVLAYVRDRADRYDPDAYVT